MTSLIRKTLIPACAGAAMIFAGAAPASAATQLQDGLVNVAVGDITIEDAVDVNVGAQVAANICGVEVGPVAVLGEAVDNDGAARTVCTNDLGQDVVIYN